VSQHDALVGAAPPVPRVVEAVRLCKAEWMEKPSWKNMRCMHWDQFKKLLRQEVEYLAKADEHTMRALAFYLHDAGHLLVSEMSPATEVVVLDLAWFYTTIVTDLMGSGGPQARRNSAGEDSGHEDEDVTRAGGGFQSEVWMALTAGQLGERCKAALPMGDQGGLKLACFLCDLGVSAPVLLELQNHLFGDALFGPRQKPEAVYPEESFVKATKLGDKLLNNSILQRAAAGAAGAVAAVAAVAGAGRGGRQHSEYGYILPPPLTARTAHVPPVVREVAYQLRKSLPVQAARRFVGRSADDMILVPSLLGRLHARATTEPATINDPLERPVLRDGQGQLLLGRSGSVCVLQLVELADGRDAVDVFACSERTGRMPYEMLDDALELLRLCCHECCPGAQSVVEIIGSGSSSLGNLDERSPPETRPTAPIGVVRSACKAGKTTVLFGGASHSIQRLLGDEEIRAIQASGNAPGKAGPPAAGAAAVASSPPPLGAQAKTVPVPAHSGELKPPVGKPVPPTEVVSGSAPKAPKAPPTQRPPLGAPAAAPAAAPATPAPKQVAESRPKPAVNSVVAKPLPPSPPPQRPLASPPTGGTPGDTPGGTPKGKGKATAVAAKPESKKPKAAR